MGHQMFGVKNGTAGADEKPLDLVLISWIKMHNRGILIFLDMFESMRKF